MRRLRNTALVVCALVPIESAAEDGRLVHPDVGWVLEAGDDAPAPSLLEQVTGTHVGPEDWPDPVWNGDMLLDRDSMAADQLGAMNLPLPALDYEAVPGVLYVEMAGVTLSPFCGNGDTANASLNCSPLVSQETTFPAYGSAQQQGATFQTLRGYYDPFDLTLSTQRPPEYLPYTMAVIGGSASLAGLGGGVCGVANVACDGLKRNHVSLTFPQSCGGVPEIAAQETSHNWGLEHTDNTTDLLYPFANGGFKTFVDQCMGINHATGNGQTACGYVHEVYCPSGGGEQQNSYAELLGVFGAARDDTSAPQIVSIYPEDGAHFEVGDTLTVTAMVEEDSGYFGAQWTWVDGLPPDIESLTKCTNKTCDQHFTPSLGMSFNEINWDFVTLQEVPEGVYTFRFDVMDTQANTDSRTITFTVGEAQADSGSGDGTDGGTESNGGTVGESGEGGNADRGGGGCRTVPAQAPWLAVLLGLMFVRRQR